MDLSNESAVKIETDSAKEIENLEDEARSLLVPSKSRKKYNCIYDNYVKWRNSNNLFDSREENTLLAYFSYLSESKAPSTLWSTYSALKTMIYFKEHFNISNYFELKRFIKRKNEGWKPKKSEILSTENILNFLDNAPDEVYLALKVIIIISVNGACRNAETTFLKKDDVKKQGDIFLVTLNDTIDKKSRSFVILEEFCPYVQKYIDLRPASTQIDRFFLRYQNGKCHNQPIGINKISQTPRLIAEYLNLPKPKDYFGNRYCRAVTTLTSKANLIEKDIKTAKRCVVNTEKIRKNSACFIENEINKSLTSKTIFHKIFEASTTFAQNKRDESLTQEEAENLNFSQEELDELFNTGFESSSTTKLNKSGNSKDRAVVFNNCVLNITYNN